MLNNDFKELVGKYRRYQHHQKRLRNRKILLAVLMAALAYYVSTLDFKKLLHKNTTEQNLSAAPTPKDNTTLVQDPLFTPTPTSKQEENVSQPAPIEKPKKEKKKKKVHKKKVQKPKLKVTSRKNSLKELLANQASSQSYSATIALANFHYSRKEYEEAIKWSISASKKNKSRSRPWIIYAKSKKALGKKQIARKALKLFLKKHPDEEVQNLLNSL